MKSVRLLVVLALVLGTVGTAAPLAAQEHWTEGPVWLVSYYRTRPGQFDNYMKYLRKHYLPQNAESKKQGLFLDSKIVVRDPASKDDWDVAFLTLYSSAAKAFDFNQADFDKERAIATQHFKTADQEKQEQTSAPRLEMRDFIGTRMMREVMLRPMP